MKKIIMLMSLITVSSTVFAQQGSWYIGGQVGFSKSTSEDASSGIKNVSSDWAFSPEFGTFLKDDIQLGIALGIGGGKNESDGTTTYKYSTLSPILYGRKFFKITDSFSTFAGLYLNFISEKSTDYGPTIESTGSGFGARIGVGVAYALSPRFTAIGQYGLLGFESIKNKVDGTETTTDSSFDFGVNTVGGSVFNVGIYYTFKQ